MERRILLLPVLCVLFVVLCMNTQFNEACEMDQTHYGCRIDNRQCTCAYGCRSEYRYSTTRECQDALKGRSNNLCSSVPCMNGGSCIQISQMPGYKCRCEGTGYHGSRCQRKCPSLDDKRGYPLECIVI